MTQAEGIAAVAGTGNITVPGLRVANFEITGPNEATVTVASKNKQLTTGPGARQLAIRTATPQIGPCGFSSFEFWGYQNPDGTVLEEQQMMGPGALKSGGEYLQQVKVKARI
jgi:hypothetical protein